MISIGINNQRSVSASTISISINDPYQHQRSASDQQLMISISINDQHQYQ
jgi:hypothetical protein